MDSTAILIAHAVGDELRADALAEELSRLGHRAQTYPIGAVAHHLPTELVQSSAVVVIAWPEVRSRTAPPAEPVG